MPNPRRPVFSLARSVVPLPANASKMMPPRLEQSSMASLTSASGFGVGCSPSVASRSFPKLLMPAYSHTFVLLLPKRPSSTLLMCLPRPLLYTKTNSWADLYNEPMPALLFDQMQMFLSSV